MTTRRLELRKAADVKPKAVTWLWDARIPLGKVTILAGPAGQGKSQTTCFVAAHVSNGTLPGDLMHTPGDVLLISAEDDPEDTIVPRLMAVNANRDRIHFVDMREVIDGQHVPSTVTLPGDAPRVREAVEQVSARLIVVDPISGLLDEAHSTWSNQQVRRALAPLVTLAQEHACAVLCVMHPNKSSGTNALARIADSGAFTALARSVLFQGPDPSDPEGERGARKVLALPKSNLAGRGEHGLSLAIDETTVEGITAPRIQVLGSSDVTAAEVIAAGEDDSALGEARAFLRDELADGPRAASEVKDAAREAGLAEPTLRRAREVECKRPSKERGPRGRWMWELKVITPDRPFQDGHLDHLPPKDDQGVQDVQGGNTTDDDHLAAVEVWDFTR